MPGAVRRDVRQCLALTLDRPSARSWLEPSALALDILTGSGQSCGALFVVAPSNWPRCLPRLAGRFFSRGGTAARRTSPSIVVTQGVEFQGNAGFLRCLRPRQGGRGSLPLLAASRLTARPAETLPEVRAGFPSGTRGRYHDRRLGKPRFLRIMRHASEMPFCPYMEFDHAPDITRPGAPLHDDEPWSRRSAT